MLYFRIEIGKGRKTYRLAIESMLRMMMSWYGEKVYLKMVSDN